jgi:tRNA/tmRNA/rRNA uracil-C5-methylase (TrmA/RlmC/RlmD family)
MARDAMLLAKAGYGVHSWTLFDTFPRTAHMEAVALFTRAKPA